MVSRTDTSITLTVITGAEYRLGLVGIWQPSPVFSGLDPNTGYVFYARLAETATHEASPPSPISATITTDIAQHTVTYKPNGGEGDDIIVTVTHEQLYTLAGNTFIAPEGNKFTKWNTSTDGEGTDYMAGEQVTITGNIELYAIWDAYEPTMDISIDSRIIIMPMEPIAPNHLKFQLSAKQGISGNLFVAAYDARGVMINILSQPFSLTTDESATVEASIPYVEGITYKFFIWDSNYIPLTAITSVDDL